MDIQIDELVSTVHAMDGQTVLSPEVLREVVRIAIAAVRDELAHDRRMRTERSVGATDASAD